MRDAITFLPYAITVDHFQHLVYEKPEATPEERKQMWLNLEKFICHGAIMGSVVLRRQAPSGIAKVISLPVPFIISTTLLLKFVPSNFI